MTFCVDGDVERIEVEARWGCYVRIPNDQHHCTKIITRKIRNEAREVVRTVEEEVKCKVWQRIPCGGS